MSDNRATCWSVTVNNPTPATEEQIALARQKGWKVDGQLEKGSKGTPHYQLMVRTPQVRFAAVTKQFPGAHVEQARNPAALSKYVAKEDTRVGVLAAPSDYYPSLSRYWELVISTLDAWGCINHNHICNPKEERGPFWWKTAPSRYRSEPLVALDDVTAHLIEQGYHVESLACNPNIRMQWRKFHAAIAIRYYVDKDRQTDNCVQMAQENISSVDIPDANADAPSHTPSGILEGQHHEETLGPSSRACS